MVWGLGFVLQHVATLLSEDEIKSTKDVFKALNAGNAWRSVVPS